MLTSRGKTPRRTLVGSLTAARIGPELAAPAEAASAHCLGGASRRTPAPRLPRFPRPGYLAGRVPVAWAIAHHLFFRSPRLAEVVVLVTAPNGPRRLLVEGLRPELKTEDAFGSLKSRSGGGSTRGCGVIDAFEVSCSYQFPFLPRAGQGILGGCQVWGLLIIPNVRAVLGPEPL